MAFNFVAEHLPLWLKLKLDMPERQCQLIIP